MFHVKHIPLAPCLEGSTGIEKNNERTCRGMKGVPQCICDVLSARFTREQLYQLIKELSWLSMKSILT